MGRKGRNRGASLSFLPLCERSMEKIDGRTDIEKCTVLDRINPDRANMDLDHQLPSISLALIDKIRVKVEIQILSIQQLGIIPRRGASPHPLGGGTGRDMEGIAHINRRR
jgi:hypothetical protein